MEHETVKEKTEREGGGGGGRRSGSRRGQECRCGWGGVVSLVGCNTLSLSLSLSDTPTHTHTILAEQLQQGGGRRGSGTRNLERKATAFEVRPPCNTRRLDST